MNEDELYNVKAGELFIYDPSYWPMWIHFKKCFILEKYISIALIFNRWRIFVTEHGLKKLSSDPIHVALYIIHLFDTHCSQRFTIRSHTRGSLYYTFIWHILFSEIYHQILYTWLSILYIYLTHVVFRHLPSDLIHVAIYIIHLFDTCCF